MFKNNGKLKLIIIVGTRPEIIRLSEIIKKCKKYFDCILVHTGQNYDYELNDIFFNDLNLEKPDIYLNSVGENLGSTIGNIISESYKLMSSVKPDALLVLGDTNSCLSAISAKRLHIPIFHMEAGNRCKDELLPEETNRRIVDIISDVNLCYSENARVYLHECGLPKDRVFKTGSPMSEVLEANFDKIRNSSVLNDLNLYKNKFILLSAHREENIDNKNNFYSLFNSINSLAKKYNIKVLYSCHPRSKKMIEKNNFKFDNRVFVHPPISFTDYNFLQMNAFCVISDSGTLPEEASFYLKKQMPISAVSIRTSTERPEALDKAVFTLAGITEIDLLNAVELAVNLNKNNDFGDVVLDYSDLNVSTKVVNIIQSYTSVVDRTVWKKL